MATYVPTYMSGAEAYPDDPQKAQAVEDERNARVAREEKQEPAPRDQPPAGLKPNEVLAWASAGGAAAASLPSEPVPPPQPGKKSAKIEIGQYHPPRGEQQ